MTFSKITMVGTAIIFLSLLNVANAAEERKTTEAKQDPKIEEYVSNLEKLDNCDQTAKGKNVCERYCTGDGVFESGNCSIQEVWEQCAKKCPAALIKPCIDTVNSGKYNLSGKSKCK